MDWFAVASRGVFPTPTPSGAERAAYIATAGLFSGPLPATSGSTGAYGSLYLDLSLYL